MTIHPSQAQLRHRGAQPPQQILDAIMASLPGIRGLALLNRQGQVEIAAGELSHELAGLLSFAVGAQELLERTSEEAGCGETMFTLIRADQGHIALHTVGTEQMLFTLADAQTPLGTLAHDLAWCAQQLAPHDMDARF